MFNPSSEPWRHCKSVREILCTVFNDITSNQTFQFIFSHHRLFVSGIIDNIAHRWLIELNKVKKKIDPPPDSKNEREKDDDNQNISLLNVKALIRSMLLCLSAGVLTLALEMLERNSHFFHRFWKFHHSNFLRLKSWSQRRCRSS